MKNSQGTVGTLIVYPQCLNSDSHYRLVSILRYLYYPILAKLRYEAKSGQQPTFPEPGILSDPSNAPRALTCRSSAPSEIITEWYCDSLEHVVAPLPKFRTICPIFHPQTSVGRGATRVCFGASKNNTPRLLSGSL